MATPKEDAERTAKFLRMGLGIESEDLVGVILGTGWGDKLPLENQQVLPFDSLIGFQGLKSLQGHDRKFIYGECRGKPVLAAQGRIHLNERMGNDVKLSRMVRLQTETMIQCGVTKLIVTCAAGSLPGHSIETGGLVVIDGFVTLFAPPMPLEGGEFASPEDALSHQLMETALEAAPYYSDTVTKGGYAMLRGPFFEGRKYDKEGLAIMGASVVGMSTLPEACIVALYPEVQMLGLAFVSNDCLEAHSHEKNIDRAKASADGLSTYLQEVIYRI